MSTPVPATRRLVRPLATLLLAVGCWAVGLVLFGIGLEADGIDLDHTTDHQAVRIWLDILGGLVGSPLVAGVRSRRRRRAFAASLLMAVAAAASLWALPAFAWAVVSVSSWRSRWHVVVLDALALLSATASLPLLLGQRPSVTDVVVMVVMLVALNLWGLYRGQRAALVDAYRERALGLEREARAAEREHQARLAQVRADERAAIAREMHDTLSHRLAVIALHAGGLASRPDLPPERVTETATLLADVARQGSEELRTLLTVLRDPADRANAVGIDEAPRLVAEARALGLDVTLHCDDELAGRLPSLAPHRSAALAQALHEGLANATKHAPDQHVTATLAGDGDGVCLEVANAVSSRPVGLAGGFGLVGLDERLRLAGGTLRHGVADGRHELVAWVPW